MAPELFAPSLRLQDELHLLKDSLGAVDAHYESILDHLENQLSGRTPKILASSATLAGYEQQVATLYRRAGRVFPVPGPEAGSGFWARETEELARRFVAVAPRGVTMEFATDRLLTELQIAARRLQDDPQGACAEMGVDVLHAADLLSLYGTDVVYGNTLRDLDASTRSIESQQVGVQPLNFASLTGRTPFDEVRRVLERLEQPEDDFNERIHVITASSMMSHGVDIDRLNIMVMLGLPLTTAEYIQATSRIGRRWPGLIFVFHRIGRERDAGIYRVFPSFVKHGDRFVEPIPVTRRSRRVLQRTLPGLEKARILGIHEPASGTSLTTVGKLRSYFRDASITAKSESDELLMALGFTDDLDQYVREDLREWFEAVFSNLLDPGGSIRFPDDLFPESKPMMSLRDVEEVAPVRD